METVVRSKMKVYCTAIAGIVLLILGVITSISVGAADIDVAMVLKSFFEVDSSKEQTIIRTLRLPRALVGALVGANLAVAGALMQAITRNSLASPQVFGVNAGASFFIVTSFVFFPNLSSVSLVCIAFIGAAVGGMAVYSFASGGGMTQVKLALAGMAVHFFLSSLTQGMIIFNEQAKDVLYWLVGSINGKTWTHVNMILPWSLSGLFVAVLFSRSVSILVLGENMAQGLGQRVYRIRILAGILVIILAGSSVAVAGPVGFIGLIIPHIVRRLVGGDYRRIIPFSALFGALLLVYADILARFIAYPFESPVGIVTAIIGAPFFLYLAKRGRNIKQ
ncbi:FecCD family ABC transporter permease [Peribacillus butanolivorans]|uniref:FecCD family ABC transporter permease n=1 Tax=Peribacillus butanolivorans TaxID=421767 RepID=UPI0006F567B4|nr:iron ABC transporter permease [Peribacillus butanolivorans]KQU26175.1 iron-siderophore ABC transporter permease [Bacillus sp. Leaf13]MCO0596946.1 iron ABC transporter permease [Peribacillus butanolivorans]MED3690866.1 iron ABC transporter permease [Peribacillus butanolivorans]